MPAKLLFALEPWLRRAVSAVYYTGDVYYCGICESGLRSFVQTEQGDDLCPRCGSLPRTRRLWDVLQQELPGNNPAVLDFSPSRSIYRRLKAMPGISYHSSDLSQHFLADHAYDITQIACPDSHFDVIICYHVLEHIPDDHKAMQELWRVLRPGGLCLIQTPFKEGDIYEDETIATPADRLQHFGQDDHVRIYSVSGLTERLSATGFEITTNIYQESVDNRKGYKPYEVVLLARKPG